MNYIIGIDIGTTNSKAVAYDPDGNVVAQDLRTYPHISPQEGYFELDPEVLFQAVQELLKNIVARLVPNKPAGICFSSAMHGLIAVDAMGMPLTNMITWADLRSSAYAKQLKNTETGKRIYERTGTPVHAMAPLCKLMWMKENLSEVFFSAHKFISIKEYIFYHFFGEFIVDRSVASSTGLFDIYSLDWNADALHTAGINAEKLSGHVSTGFIIKGLNKKYASLLNLHPETPFIIGASDGCLAHLGSNALHTRDISITIGTSGAVRVMTEKPVHDPKQRIFNYLLTDDLFISGGPVNNGGNVLQWFAKSFLKKDYLTPDDLDLFIQEAVNTPAGCEGLIFLPYIYGERAPVWDADARGLFYGVSSIHTMAHFMRAIMEGISFALYSILETIEESYGPSNKIYASGGFIRSKEWVKLLADVLGKKVFVTHGEDSSAAGAAILGMKALGITTNLHDLGSFFPDKEIFEPDLNDHQVYLRNYNVYSKLYDKLKDIKN